MRRSTTIQKYFSFFVAISLISSTFQIFPLSTPTKISFATTAALGTYLGYSYFSSPEQTEPTIDTIHPFSAVPLNTTATYSDADKSLVKTLSSTYSIQPGTSACFHAKKEPLFVLASGWKPFFDQAFSCRVESSVAGLQRYLKKNIFHGPSITFVYKDNRRAFNFGQQLDQHIFDTLYKATENKNLILYGLCRGATTILGWLTAYDNNKNIKAVILESPALSLKDICLGIGKQYTNLSLQGWFLNLFLSIYFPLYEKEQESLIDNLDHLSLAQNVPIFIGHIKGDQITTDEKVMLLVKTLRRKCTNPIYFFICAEPLDHGALSKSTTYQQVINAFLKKYNLPHNTLLAEQGLELLTDAEKTL